MISKRDHQIISNRENSPIEVKISYETVLDIIDRTLRGQTVEKISKDLHVSKTTVKKYQKKYTSSPINIEK